MMGLTNPIGILTEEPYVPVHHPMPAEPDPGESKCKIMKFIIHKNYANTECNHLMNTNRSFN